MLQENFVETISGSINKHWDVPCFSDLDGETITYGELADRIFELHYIIAEAGLKKGDRIGLAGRNCANWCVTYLAAVTCGAVIVPILPDFSSGEIEHIVRHAECKLLFVAGSINDRLDEDKMPSVEGIFHLADFSLSWGRGSKLSDIVDGAGAGARDRYGAMLDGRKVRFPRIENGDLAAIVYTSGTTGFSKGVMLTGNSLVANIMYFLQSITLTPGDNVVSFLPLAHAFGCAFDFLAPLLQGCHVTFISKLPTPKVLVRAFDEMKPAVVMSVPLLSLIHI